MTNGVFYSEYKINQLWLVFIKDKMHANSVMYFSWGFLKEVEP